jgi:hypothetical protein
LTKQTHFQSFADAFSLLAGQALLLCLFLSCLMRTKLWQRGSSDRHNLGWQFSLEQLLFLMTVCATLAVSLKHSHEFRTDWLGHAVSVSASAALAASAVIAERANTNRRWFQFGSVLGFALVLSATVAAIAFPWDLFVEAFFLNAPFFLIQVIVLVVWLALAPIVPMPESAMNSGSNQP